MPTPADPNQAQADAAAAQEATRRHGVPFRAVAPGQIAAEELLCSANRDRPSNPTTPPTCFLPFRQLSGGVYGCVVHGLRKGFKPDRAGLDCPACGEDDGLAFPPPGRPMKEGTRASATCTACRATFPVLREDGGLYVEA